MEYILRREGSEAEEDTEKLETQLRSLRVGVYSGSESVGDSDGCSSGDEFDYRF